MVSARCRRRPHADELTATLCFSDAMAARVAAFDARQRVRDATTPPLLVAHRATVRAIAMPRSAR